MTPKLRPLLRGAVLIAPLTVGLAFLSASAQTVINIPPAAPIGLASGDTVVNLLTGGTLPGDVRMGSGATLNILGGQASRPSAEPGGTINVSGGRTEQILGVEGGVIRITGGHVLGQILHHSDLTVDGGGIARIHNFRDGRMRLSGGAVADLGSDEGSTVEILGADFQVNGAPVPGLGAIGDSTMLNLSDGDILTGTLSDGTPFAHDQLTTLLWSGTLRLTRSAPPVAGPPGDIVVTSVSPLSRAVTGQHVIVASGGRLAEQFRAGPGSHVMIQGGMIGEGFHAIGANVTIQSGSVDRRFNAYDGTVVNIEGGGLVADARFFRGSTLNVYGGSAGFDTRLYPGATANIYGGETMALSFGRESTVSVYGGAGNRITGDQGELRLLGGNMDDLSVSGAKVFMAGGAYSDSLSIRAGSELTIDGSDFRISGAPVAGLDLPGQTQMVSTTSFSQGTALTGVFTDGTPFALEVPRADQLPPTIKLVRGPGHSQGPASIHLPGDTPPLGVHAGQSLTVAAGGVLPRNFTAGYDSTVTIDGGTVGHNFDAAGAKVTMHDARTETLSAFSDSIVEITGATTYGDVKAFYGGTFVVKGNDSVGGQVFAYVGSHVDIQGGRVWRIEAHNASMKFAGIIDQVNSESLLSGAKLTVGGGFINKLASFASQVIARAGKIESLTLRQSSSLEVDGGQIGGVSLSDMSTMSVKSGIIEDSSVGNSTLRIFGGALGDGHSWSSGVIELNGSDFQLNGAPIPGLENVGDAIAFDYPIGALFSGTLADGTPFSFGGADLDARLEAKNGALRLVRTEAPTLADVHVPAQAAPSGAAPGRKVTVEAGGALGDHFVAGHDSEVEIRGGTVGENFEADRSHVVMSGGAMADGLDVLAGAVMDVSGGTVGRRWEVREGTLNVSGGSLDFLGLVMSAKLNISGGNVKGFQARNGSEITISGGVVGSELSLRTGVTALISGGEVGTRLTAVDGSVVHITGGRLRGVEAELGSRISVAGGVVESLSGAGGTTIDISGGAFADGFRSGTSGDWTMRGVDFALDGVPIAGLNQPGDQTMFSLPTGRLFTGTLADGTPFAISSAENETLGNVRLVRSVAPEPGPSRIDVSGVTAPTGVHASQVLNILPGGSVGAHFNAGAGSVVNVLGGSLGENFEAYQAVVNLESGQVARDMDAFAGSQINVRGGVVSANLDAHAGATVNLAGGRLLGLDALPGSMVNIEGGKIVRLTGGGQTSLRGGVIDSLSVGGANALTVYGVEFKLNGAAIAGLANAGDSVNVNMPANSVLSGVLEDGTPLVIDRGVQSNSISNGALRLVRSPAPAAQAPAYQRVSDAAAPFTIGAGQTLRLVNGGQLGANFIAGPGSTLDIDAGTASGAVYASGASVAITGGGGPFNLTAMNQSSLVITGGRPQGLISLMSGSKAQVYGGGAFAGPFSLEAGTSLELFGTSFLIDGKPITGLSQVGDAVTLTQRGNFRLSGTLLDGSPISMLLALPGGNRFISPGISASAALRLQLVDPSFRPGDFDGDRDVDGNDFLVWQRSDGTALGLAAWRAAYRGAGAPVNQVPEPTGWVMALCGLILCHTVGGRRRPSNG